LKKIGRPTTKTNRTKIGLSLDGQFSDKLTELSKLTGKTKSKIIEESIQMFYNKQLLINKAIENIS